MREPWGKPEKEPELLGSILKKWQKQFRLEVGWKQYKIFELWEQAIDEMTRKHAKPLSFHKHTLEVRIDSPPHYFELVNFKKKSLLKKMQKDSKIYLQDIHFTCAGKIDK